MVHNMTQSRHNVDAGIEFQSCNVEKRRRFTSYCVPYSLNVFTLPSSWCVYESTTVVGLSLNLEGL